MALSAAEEDRLQQQARHLLQDAQDGDPQLRRVALAGLGPLLARAREAAPTPATLARLLRVGVLVRDMAGETGGPPARAPDELLDELVTHAMAHGLVEYEAGAHALRGQIALARGRPDTALEAAALALVALDTAPPSYQRGLALTDVAILLVHLGLEDLSLIHISEPTRPY